MTHPAQRFLITYEELVRLDRKVSRRDWCFAALMTGCVLLNVGLLAWVGWPSALLNLASACFSALVLRRIWLWRIERKADLRRLALLAESAYWYLTPRVSDAERPTSD